MNLKDKKVKNYDMLHIDKYISSEQTDIQKMLSHIHNKEVIYSKL